MNVAVIPARGGSKRIQRKNVRPFAGRPMIAHSIRAAQASGIFDRIIVSTDDPEVSLVALQHGADVPFKRPAHLSTDMAGTAPVITHAVRFLMNEGQPPSAVCCIYATAPFVESADLQASLETLESRDLDYVFAGTTYPYPIFRSFHEIPGGGLAMFFPENAETRSQDLPEALHDAGQFYWGTPTAWLEARPVFGARTAIHRVPRWRVQDIDTEEDWTRAEIMAAYLNRFTSEGKRDPR